MFLKVMGSNEPALPTSCGAKLKILLCSGVVATKVGKFPAAKGDPGMGVSAPVLGLIVYAQTPLPVT
jgi:hypothetical protein